MAEHHKVETAKAELLEFFANCSDSETKKKNGRSNTNDFNNR
mgnify:CR=1 FL=1